MQQRPSKTYSNVCVDAFCGPYSFRATNRLAPEKFEYGVFIQKTREMFFLRTLKEKLKAEQSPAILDLYLTKTRPRNCRIPCHANKLLRSRLRGTQWVIYPREEVVLLAGYAVRGTQWVIFAREEIVLVAGNAVRGTQWVIYAREEVV